MMKIYKVGGCVRDHLMGQEPKDIDWLVVGATPEQMTQKGFVRVGADFPVFLHPQTKDEYALARKERKTSAGHKGFHTQFDPTVTVEEDLSRRDLTINAMAQDPDSGAIIDPFGGRQDLANRVLKHVSPAFAEDPLRVLRLARFQARTSFTVAPSTFELCQQIVSSGALGELSNERICAELRKLLECDRPDIGMNTLSEMGALSSIDPLWPMRLNPLHLNALRLATKAKPPEWILCRLAMTQSLNANDTSTLMERLRFPSDITRWCTRAAAFCEWSMAIDPDRIDHAHAAQMLERCALHKISAAERESFWLCVQHELTACGCPDASQAVARRALSCAENIANVDLSDALSQPKPLIPQAVKQAKIDAFSRKFQLLSNRKLGF